jgi:hypothetical protein
MKREPMGRALLMVSSLLIPVAFAGGYLLATANARVTCVLQVPRDGRGMPAVCADISSTGITTGLLFGIFGVILWAIGWAVAWFKLSRLRGPRGSDSLASNTGHQLHGD